MDAETNTHQHVEPVWTMEVQSPGSSLFYFFTTFFYWITDFIYESVCNERFRRKTRLATLPELANCSRALCEAIAICTLALNVLKFILGSRTNSVWISKTIAMDDLKHRRPILGRCLGTIVQRKSVNIYKFALLFHSHFTISPVIGVEVTVGGW